MLTRYQLTWGEPGADMPSHHKTCMEALNSREAGQIVLRDGKVLKNPQFVECCAQDIADLQEYLKKKVDEKELRQRVRAFVEEYGKAPKYTERVHFSPELTEFLLRMAKKYSCTPEQFIRALLASD